MLLHFAHLALHLDLDSSMGSVGITAWMMFWFVFRFHTLTSCESKETALGNLNATAEHSAECNSRIMKLISRHACETSHSQRNS